MSTEQWKELWDDDILRAYIARIVRSFSADEDLQEDLIQEAWLRIGQSEPGQPPEFYQHEGFKGMAAAYRREYRRWNRRLKKLSEKRYRISPNVSISI